MRVVQIGRRMNISNSVDNLYIALKILYFAILIFGSRIHEILHTVTGILIKTFPVDDIAYISVARLSADTKANPLPSKLTI